MAKFRVVIAETQYYEVYVEADTQEDAEDLAIDTYGEDGDIFQTDIEATLIEEENEDE